MRVATFSSRDYSGFRCCLQPGFTFPRTYSHCNFISLEFAEVYSNDLAIVSSESSLRCINSFKCCSLTWTPYFDSHPNLIERVQLRFFRVAVFNMNKPISISYYNYQPLVLHNLGRLASWPPNTRFY